MFDNIARMRRCASLLALALAACSSAQFDDGYAKKIREFTTEPFFLTDLVDHLPTAKGVPTPEQFLGHIVGAPNVLSYSKQTADYLRALEKASPRVKVVRMGMSEEGREMVVAIISDAANLKRLDRLKTVNALLGDPRNVQEKDVEALIKEGLPMYWATGGMHAPETGPPEMVMELAYRLAVSNDPRIETIRKNSIVMLTPVLDVDGRDRVVDLYNYRKKNPTKPPIPLVYWGKYVAHDDNRDATTMALQLSKGLMRTWLDFHPTVMHDLHESVPYLYISTGTGPYNAWLDPLTISEWQDMAYNEIQQLTGKGVPGVWTHNFYDGWSPSYGFYVANGHNGIGRFYETFSGGGADTGIRSSVPQSSREWYRPNPPFPRVRWSIRNNVNMSQSALLLGMHKVASEKEKFLRNYYLKSKRSVAKARTEGPAAWIFPGDDTRKEQQAMLLRILQEQGCEVHRLEKESAVKDGTYPAGSFVVRMDQPYSRMADMLLDTQYYRPTDPRSYDDTGWTLGLLFGVKTARVTDTAVLDAAMTRVAPISPVSLVIPGTQLPRIALVHTWTSTQDEGWARVALDQLGVPYKYVSVHELRDTADLRSKYDVILFPQTSGTGQSIVAGRPMVGDPLPWKASPEYPNVGGPDSSDDIRGGIELEGILNLKRFLNEGGMFIAIGNAARVPIEFGLVSGVTITQPDQLNAPGGVFRLDRVDKASVLLSGYGDEVAAYFNGNSLPMLSLGTGAVNRRGAQPAAGRSSGRGSATDPDVIQGRAAYVPKEKPGDVPEGGTFRAPENPQRPRVLLKFADKEKLLMSGMIVQPEELEGKAAVVHVPVGKGNVLLFSINPFWRGQTVGSYNLVINALRNWNNPN
jgi:hypothetical protein